MMALAEADIYTLKGPAELLEPACPARPPNGPRMRSARLRCCGGIGLARAQLGGAVLRGAANGALVSAWPLIRTFVKL